MTTCRRALCMLASVPMLFLAAPADAQQPSGGTPHKGRDILMAKCFQCHTDSMWRDARQDSRAWEAALYRMVGRGGLWTTDEIKQMADYLGTDFGPDKPPATQQAR